MQLADGRALAPRGREGIGTEPLGEAAGKRGARVLRYWLKGPKAGKHDVFVSRLPGFPDGVSLREGGGFWVALVNPPNALVFAARSQAFRAGVAHLLPYVEPLVKRWGAVANISASGEKVSLLLDLKGEKVTSVASVHQRGHLNQPSVKVALARSAWEAAEPLAGAPGWRRGAAIPNSGPATSHMA